MEIMLSAVCTRTGTLFDGVHHGKRVHHRGEHAHLVCRGTIHFRALSAAPEIAAADNDADFHAHSVHFHDFVHYPRDNFLIEPEALFARERFARKLE